MIVIGGMKCGTSSLYYYLNQHPQISMSSTKELNFFLGEGAWDRGVDWYSAQFESRANVRGEASPNYTAYPQWRDVAERMHLVVPEARLIYLVRDPVERIVSHYVHDYANGDEHRPLDDVLRSPDRARYVIRSRYWLQLQQYLAVYPLERVLVVAQEDLLRRRSETMSRVFAFLGVRDFADRRFERAKHVSAHKRRKTSGGVRVRSRIDRFAEIFGVRPTEWQAGGGRKAGAVFHAESILLRPFLRPVDRPAIAPSLKDELNAEFRWEIAQLRRATGQEFAEWSV